MTTNGKAKKRLPKSTGKRPGKRQLEVPGAERPTDEELDALVEHYVTARQERARMLAEVRDSAAALAEKLRERKLRGGYAYVDGETRYVVKLAPKVDGLSLKTEKLPSEELEVGAGAEAVQ